MHNLAPIGHLPSSRTPISPPSRWTKLDAIDTHARATTSSVIIRTTAYAVFTKLVSKKKPRREKPVTSAFLFPFFSFLSSLSLLSLFLVALLSALVASLCRCVLRSLSSPVDMSRAALASVARLRLGGSVLSNGNAAAALFRSQTASFVTPAGGLQRRTLLKWFSTASPFKCT